MPFLYPDAASSILRQLKEASDAGKPITLTQANILWHMSSTWEDLVDGGYVFRAREAVTVTEYGLKWYNSWQENPGSVQQPISRKRYSWNLGWLTGRQK